MDCLQSCYRSRGILCLHQGWMQRQSCFNKQLSAIYGLTDSNVIILEKFKPPVFFLFHACRKAHKWIIISNARKQEMLGISGPVSSVLWAGTKSMNGAVLKTLTFHALVNTIKLGDLHITAYRQDGLFGKLLSEPWHFMPSPRVNAVPILFSSGAPISPNTTDNHL